MCVCVCGPVVEVAGSVGGPLREPSLIGLISGSHLSQVALEELWVSTFHFQKGRMGRGVGVGSPSLMKLQALEKI